MTCVFLVQWEQAARFACNIAGGCVVFIVCFMHWFLLCDCFHFPQFSLNAEKMIESSFLPREAQYYTCSTQLHLVRTFYKYWILPNHLCTWRISAGLSFEPNMAISIEHRYYQRIYAPQMQTNLPKQKRPTTYRIGNCLRLHFVRYSSDSSNAINQCATLLVTTNWWRNVNNFLVAPKTECSHRATNKSDQVLQR